MFHICAVGYYWAEDAETLEYWTQCDGTFFDAVNMAEELKADMERSAWKISLTRYIPTKQL